MRTLRTCLLSSSCIIVFPAAQFASAATVIGQAILHPGSAGVPPASLPVSSDPIKEDPTAYLSPIDLGKLSKLGKLPPFRLDASYNRPISLREALQYAMANNLAIKVSRENWKFQRYQLYAWFGNFLPNHSIWLSEAYYNVYSTGTQINSRNYGDTVSFPLSQGGYIMYSTLAQYYRAKSYQELYKKSMNDVLLNVYLGYTQLKYQFALLQVRARAVAVSEQVLDLTEKLFKSGKLNRLSLLEAQSQLMVDRQAMQNQQVTCRKASLDLSFHLNLPLNTNLIPAESNLYDVPVVDDEINLNQMINLAQKNHPEIRSYIDSYLSQCRAIQVTNASFYPSLSVFISASRFSSTVAGPAVGVNGAANSVIAGQEFSNFSGIASAAALGQQSGLSSSPDDSSNSNASSTIAGSGGNPVQASQSGGLIDTGSVSPSFVPPMGGGAGTVDSLDVSGGVFPGLVRSVELGFEMNWYVQGAYLSNLANLASQRAVARANQQQLNQKVEEVSKNLRQDFGAMHVAHKAAEQGVADMDNSKERLRLTILRFEKGVATSRDIVKAEQDYVQALIERAKWLVGIAQVKATILRDVGIISIDSLAPQKPSR